MELTQEKLILLVILLAAVVGGFVYYLSWRRRKEIEEMALSSGFTYSPYGPEAYAMEGTGIELFRHGRSRSAENMVQVPLASGFISVFDYGYVTGSGRNRHYHKFTVAFIEAPGVKFPDFDLKPETFIYKLGEMVGFKDIDLPAFPEFSEKYRLTGPDEAAVHLFFTPRRAAWFEQHLGLHAQGGRGGMVMFLRSGTLSAADWRTLLDTARLFASEALR